VRPVLQLKEGCVNLGITDMTFAAEGVREEAARQSMGLSLPMPSRLEESLQTLHGEKSFAEDCNMDLFLLSLSLIRFFFICCSVTTRAMTSQKKHSDALGADTSAIDTVHRVLAQHSRRTHRKKWATKLCFMDSAFPPSAFTNTR